MFFHRTFHPDEANQAFTAGTLLETGHYSYKPSDHHGPTLYYAAAPLQKAFGHHDTASLDGTLLRCTPLLFAVLALILAFLGVRKATKNTAAALFSCSLLAVAPIFAFYSSDFIQEMLLAAFFVAMFWAGINYLRHPSRLKDAGETSAASSVKIKPGTWAIIFGIAAGLAFATKETSVLGFAAAALAGWCVRPKGQHVRYDCRALANDGCLAAIAFLLTSILFFSAFCEDWNGVWNAFVAAPLSYFRRAAGDAAAGGANWHVHPWWWYSKILFFPDRICFSLAFLPIVTYPLLFRFRHAKPLAFLALYSFFLFAFYSTIPYKTPWCMLQVAVPMLLAYGILLGEIAKGINHGRVTAFAAFILPLTVFLLGDIQIWRDPDARDIPYNYAHASPKVKELAACVAAAATSDSQASTSDSQFIAVALPACDTWPFPWYNRPLNGITGYWTDFSALENLAKDGKRPTVVVCAAEDGHKVMPLFPHLNRTRRFEMRPRVRVRAFWREP